MDNQEALILIQEILAPHELSYVEQLVIRNSWEGKRYREMALALDYEEGYLRDTGSRLWQLLSNVLGYPVTKKRLRYVMAEIVTQRQSSKTDVVGLATVPDTRATSKSLLLSEFERPIEYPGSPLAFGSPLYIQRPPVEDLAISALQHPGGLLRITAPWHMGKTSLLNYLVGECQQLGYATVVVDMRQVDTTSLENLDAFFRWFCWSINQQLNLAWDLDKYWFEDAGSKLNCTTYMQEYLLTQIKSPLVIVIDTCHALMEYPVVARNFFAMLRSWYEQAKVRPQWQQLRLVLAHAANLDLPVHAHQSPFNVGLQVELTGLTSRQIHALSQCYSLGEIQDKEAVALMSLEKLVGGHPYLMQLAFYWLKAEQLSLTQILQTAATNQGIYREYLHGLWLFIQQRDGLAQALHQILLTPEPIYLNPEQAYGLAGVGIVDIVGHQVKLRCELYRRYFSEFQDS